KSRPLSSLVSLTTRSSRRVRRTPASALARSATNRSLSSASIPTSVRKARSLLRHVPVFPVVLHLVPELPQRRTVKWTPLSRPKTGNPLLHLVRPSWSRRHKKRPVQRPTRLGGWTGGR